MKDDRITMAPDYDRGELDITKYINELKDTIKGYKVLIDIHKKELWDLKQIASENEKNKNLLQGYKKVIQDLSAKLRQKDS